LLLKENYLIVSLEGFEDVISVIESKCLNDCFETTERYQHGMKIKNIKIVNVKQLKLTCTKLFDEQIKDEIHLLNKVNYIPLGVIEKHRSDNQQMELEDSNQKSTKSSKKLNIGQIVEGKITSIKKNNIFVLLDQKL
jgi:ribosomal protein S1